MPNLAREIYVPAHRAHKPQASRPALPRALAMTPARDAFRQIAWSGRVVTVVAAPPSAVPLGGRMTARQAFTDVAWTGPKVTTAPTATQAGRSVEAILGNFQWGD